MTTAIGMFFLIDIFSQLVYDLQIKSATYNVLTYSTFNDKWLLKAAKFEIRPFFLLLEFLTFKGLCILPSFRCIQV